MGKRILRLEDQFWRIRTDTGELTDAERDALRAYLNEMVSRRQSFTIISLSRANSPGSKSLNPSKVSTRVRRMYIHSERGGPPSEGICCRWVQVPLPHLLNVPRTWGIAMNYLLRLTPSGIQIRGMAHPQSLRHPLFRRRWFADDFFITCVRWYLRFKLSYRDLAQVGPGTWRQRRPEHGSTMGHTFCTGVREMLASL
jgi:hypothetical protein